MSDLPTLEELFEELFDSAQPPYALHPQGHPVLCSPLCAAENIHSTVPDSEW